VFCLFNTNIDQFENQALFAVAAALILYRNRCLQEASTVPAHLASFDATPSSAHSI
jgi:hypothetical protein